MSYATPPGGLPPQGTRLHDRAVFTDAYAVIPASVQRDIVTSFLPGWRNTRAWVLARPLTGFAETFSQMIVEVAAGGGTTQGEPEPLAEGVVFVTKGAARLTVDGTDHAMEEGGYAYLPAGTEWRLGTEAGVTFVWVRKRYQGADGIAAPSVIVTADAETPINWMPGAEDIWGTQRFVDPADLSHDMHVNIVTFGPGGTIPFAETHVMEHGIYVLEGLAVYHLNGDWVEVEAGDFLWLRAFCPQACYAAGPGRFRYLLYKDVNRFPPLTPVPQV